jgi:hypothetical protein
VREEDSERSRDCLGSKIGVLELDICGRKELPYSRKPLKYL